MEPETLLYAPLMINCNSSLRCQWWEKPHPAVLHHCQKAMKSLSAIDQNSDSNVQVAIVKKEGSDGRSYTAALFGIPGMELFQSTITKALP